MNHHDHSKAAAREGFRPGIAPPPTPGTFADTDAGHIDLPALFGDMEVEAGFCCEGDSGHTIPALDLDKSIAPVAEDAPTPRPYRAIPVVHVDRRPESFAVVTRDGKAVLPPFDNKQDAIETAALLNDGAALLARYPVAGNRSLPRGLGDDDEEGEGNEDENKTREQDAGMPGSLAGTAMVVAGLMLFLGGICLGIAAVGAGWVTIVRG